MLALLTFVFCVSLARVSGHSSIFHPSMYGFNVTPEDFDYDNRPVTPLRGHPFNKWWFHNHLHHPPNSSDIFDLPAGKPATAEIACHKAATSYFDSSGSKDIREPNNPNNPCPGSPTTAFHTQDIDGVEGCALAIAYKSDVWAVQPEDFTVFTVNHTCVWSRFTDFQVPKRMPPCPQGGCICAFFWIHNPYAGGEEMYMNGFNCKISGSTSNVAVAKSKVPRRCGAEPPKKKEPSPGNCTYGAKTPFYWLQSERNNVFEGEFSPPVYNDLYNFLDGAQDDIFEDSYVSIPKPSPNAALPVLNNNTTNGTPKPNNSSSNNSSSSSRLRSSTRRPSSTSSSLTSASFSPSSSPSTSGCRRSMHLFGHFRRDLQQVFAKRQRSRNSVIQAL